MSEQAHVPQEEYFEAKVVEILDERSETLPDGTTVHQQNIKVRGLDGKWRDRKIIVYGISDIEVVNARIVHPGDRVLMIASSDLDGNERFYISDVIRRTPLLWLAILFILAVLVVGRLKGLRALVVLIITFVVILLFIVPKIVDGSNPFFISIAGSLVIMAMAIYLTEGINRKSHVEFAAFLITLVLAVGLSVLFTRLTSLSGASGEEALYISSIANGTLNLQGLLLASIIIGILGVIDDTIVSQTSLVKEIAETDPDLSRRNVYKKAMRVGVDHSGAIINTLFLAYVGASLPLLILFTRQEKPLS